MKLAAPAVWLLAIGQTLTYAALYYGFPALLPRLIAETGWTKAELAFGPTLAFLVMVGTALTAEAFDVELPKGYIYAAMAFSLAVEARRLAVGTPS